MRLPPMSNADFTSRSAQDNEATRVVPRGAASSTLAPGTLLGHTYMVEGLVGRGGMGEVYRAKHIGLDTEHAVKVMLPSLSDDPKILQLFQEEARKLRLVNNDAVVKYDGFFRDERGLWYLVTEFVHGETLEQVLRRRRLEPDEVLRLRNRLALGLAAAHEKDLVHRDVSPENILLPNGDIDRAKLIDFGIAKSTNSSAVTIIGGDFAGKDFYASPEQIVGERVDLRSDIYSLGLVLAAAAIGFGRRLDIGSRQRVPDLSEVPAALRPQLRLMLKPRPDDRPPSMHALLSKEGEARDAAARGLSKELPSPKRRLALWAGLATVGLLVFVAVMRVVLWWAIPPPPPPSIEEIATQIAAATSEYGCASLDYTVNPDHSVQLSGFAPTQGDIDRLRSAVDKIGGIKKLVFDVGLRSWPYCEAVALLQPVVKRTPAPAPSLALVPPGPGAHIGNALVIDTRAPSFDGYIYIDYFVDAEGDVIHLFPNPKDLELVIRPARNRMALGKPPLFNRCWTLGGTAGEQQLVTLTAATKPLFREQRPEQENARDYLPSLSDAIKTLPQGNSSAAALLFFQLLNPLPFGAQQNACQ
jgi:serine/threonine protein kinase